MEDPRLQGFQQRLAHAARQDTAVSTARQRAATLLALTQAFRERVLANQAHAATEATLAELLGGAQEAVAPCESEPVETDAVVQAIIASLVPLTGVEWWRRSSTRDARCTSYVPVRLPCASEHDSSSAVVRVALSANVNVLWEGALRVLALSEQGRDPTHISSLPRLDVLACMLGELAAPPPPTHAAAGDDTRLHWLLWWLAQLEETPTMGTAEASVARAQRDLLLECAEGLLTTVIQSLCACEAAPIESSLRALLFGTAAEEAAQAQRLHDLESAVQNTVQRLRTHLPLPQCDGGSDDEGNDIGTAAKTSGTPTALYTAVAACVLRRSLTSVAEAVFNQVERFTAVTESPCAASADGWEIEEDEEKAIQMGNAAALPVSGVRSPRECLAAALHVLTNHFGSSIASKDAGMRSLMRL